jgi:hypothetical protein
LLGSFSYKTSSTHQLNADTQRVKTVLPVYAEMPGTCSAKAEVNDTPISPS